jgi:uncharacterized protein YndB with AHSA1/START domain
MKTILVDAIDGLVLKDGSIFKEMHAMLDAFPNRKIVLTGANDKQFKEFKLDEVPYEVFTLKHDPEKTDPKYFEMMLAHYKLSANDVIFFGHNPEAVKSAEVVGIETYYYDSDKRDITALEEFLNSNLMTSDVRQLEQTYVIKAPVAKVWQALTDVKVAEQWGAAPAKVDPKEGGEFSYWNGDIHGVFTKLVPEKLIKQDWYGHDNPTWKYTVKFTFEDNGDSTTVHLLLSGDIVDEQRDINDWRQYYFDPIKELLEQQT